jgi:hypothetical protein
MSKTSASGTILPLPSLIRASSWDAGNESMRKGGRKVWSRKDYNAAAECQSRLIRSTYGLEGEDEKLAFIRFSIAERLQKDGALHIGMTYRQFVTTFNEAVAA